VRPVTLQPIFFFISELGEVSRMNVRIPGFLLGFDYPQVGNLELPFKTHLDVGQHCPEDRGDDGPGAETGPDAALTDQRDQPRKNQGLPSRHILLSRTGRTLP